MAAPVDDSHGMSNSVCLLQNVLQQGFDSENSLVLLNEFRTALTAVTQAQLRSFVTNVSLQPLFTCLQSATTINNNTNRERNSVIGAILNKLFGCMEADVVMNQFRDELLMGLDHSDNSIQLVCLKQVTRFSSTSQSEVQALCSDVGLMTSIINRIGDDCLSVAQEASSVLQVMCKTDSKALHVLFNEGSFLAHIRRVACYGDIFRYRVFEVATKVATHSPASLMVIANCNLLKDLISDLNTEDELIQMNAIEMLSDLVCSKHGYLYMEEQGVLCTMENMLIASEVQPILLPSLLKLFISICRSESNDISMVPNCFLKLTLDLLGSHDIGLLANAVDAISIVGSSVEGKEALFRQGHLMNEGLSHMVQIVQQPPMEARIRSLMALANLFSLKDEEQTSRLLSILEQWFMQISTKPLQTFLSICKQPFPELKCASLLVIKAIANQAWAQRLMNQNAGFHEYLLDRTTEHEQTGKHAKYFVIKALVQSETSAESFGRPFLLRLIEYVQEGPLYKILQSRVSLEI